MSTTTTPLLDHWAPPADAGHPVAVLASTFALDEDSRGCCLPGAFLLLNAATLVVLLAACALQLFAGW